MGRKIKSETILYEVLRVESKATPQEIRKAYHKCAWRLQPHKYLDDKFPKEKLQQLQKVISILGDEEKRAVYDQTGSVDDVDLSGDAFANLRDFFKFQTMYKKVTEADIEKFQANYKGSESEKKDLIELFNKFKGNMNRLFCTMLFSDPKLDSHRFKDILDEAIAAGEVKSNNAYEKWAKKLPEVKQRPKSLCPPPCKFAYIPPGTTVTIKEFDIIKLTAQFLAVYGIAFQSDLFKTNPQFEPHFQFMKSTDPRYELFCDLILGYLKVLLYFRMLWKEGTSRATVLEVFFNLVSQVIEKEDDKGVEKMAMSDVPAFEFFVNMEYYGFPAPSGNLSTLPLEPLSFPLLPQGIPITRNELDIIKLTAQFVAVFGGYLQQDLIERVLMNPELEPLFRFTAPTDSKHDFYSQLAHGYSRVLLRSKKLRNKDTSKVVEGFSSLVHKVLKRAEDEDVVEMAMIDLYTYEFFVEVVYGDGPGPSRGSLAMVNPPPQMQPLPEKRQPKRLKFDKPAHPGSSKIRASVGQVIEITVQSFSENVASLKDKIGNKLKGCVCICFLAESIGQNSKQH